MVLNQEKINEIYLEVQRRTLHDEDFKDLLLKNPNAAIEKVAGFPVHESFKFKVIEHDPAFIATFALPPVGFDEITDEDLEMVAGGIDFMTDDNNNNNHPSC